MLRAVATAFLLLLALPGRAAADTIAGVASVIDGDTIEIHGERIRMFGIDAPETRQLCTISSQPYRCGQQAALALADYLAQRTVRCQERDRDRYGRMVAVCYVDNEDISGWMVEEGWALAFRKYSLDYVTEEAAARAAGRGVWRGEFDAPWEWRVNRHAKGTPDRRTKRTPLRASLRACPGSEQEGPARDAERPDERRSGARGRCLFAHLGKPGVGSGEGGEEFWLRRGS